MKFHEEPLTTPFLYKSGASFYQVFPYSVKVKKALVTRWQFIKFKEKRHYLWVALILLVYFFKKENKHHGCTFTLRILLKAYYKIIQFICLLRRPLHFPTHMNVRRLWCIVSKRIHEIDYMLITNLIILSYSGLFSCMYYVI